MRLSLLAVVIGAVVAVPAFAAPPLAPGAAQVAAPRRIEGFRSARFRMTQSEVRRALSRDFPGATIVERRSPGEGTTVFEISRAALDPGPGPATISYVFGATSRSLVQVSVVWETPASATPEQRQAMAIAALRLRDYFAGSSQPRTVVAPKVLRPGVVSVYGALDDRGAGLELVASGVAYGSAAATVVAPTGPAALRLSYMANPASPDISPRAIAAR